jgi:hypothetical protein
MLIFFGAGFVSGAVTGIVGGGVLHFLKSVSN